ncbi:protein phosphatase 1 regulatory subunit 42-like [Actinia tenebrosa]|uniref:Protein phosphatase 1 regulatory subunit 42-like n=1 Tax=Actinia tenebrosa TaxID=6105 RepID=A0A6P8I3U5_ACTTE|nr:protein phosphatase 1 regulatory subunit 42-like [Actinia tenebrosa]
MGKITLEMLAKCPSHTKKKRGETLNHYLKRLTHLYFAEKGIDEIDNLSSCKNLSVLYLYDNSISRIRNLSFAANLTHLYLQNNKLSRIEGLDHCKKLSKLYLGSNCITVVEGLEKLENLKELHIEKQRLPPGEKLLFEPRSLQSLAKCLSVLNISENNIDAIEELKCLTNMTQFIVENNYLTDMKELSRVLASWTSLWRLETTGNPFCCKKKYRDRVIIMSRSLVMLDGKEINETARSFLMNWKANKDARRLHKRQYHLEAPSSNSLSTIPTLATLQGSFHSNQPGSGYLVEAGVSPLIRLAGPVEPSQATTFSRNTKTLAAMVQARAPNSTLLKQRGQAPDISMSRFPNIFAPPRPMVHEPSWETDSDLHSGPPLPLQT